MTDGVPRVDELFSRAVVAQLAEQRAQRETFAELERRLEALERLVTDRLTELSRLLHGGEVELRLELLEEEFGQRFTHLETVLKGEVESHLSAMGRSVGERLGRVEEALRSDDLGRRLSALELGVAERISHLEESLRGGGEDVIPRLIALDRQLTERLGALEGLVGRGEFSVAQRLGLLEEKVVADDVVPRFAALERQLAQRLEGLEEALARSGEGGGADVGGQLDALEATLDERFGHLGEQVRGDEIRHRLRALELAIDERSSRLEEFVRTTDVEQRIDEFAKSVEQRLDGLQADLAAAGVGDEKLAAIDRAVGQRLGQMEGSLRQLEDVLASRFDAMAQAHTAAEAGILERIIAESKIVGAHFQAVRPVVEAMATAGPDLEAALTELRKLAETARFGPTDAGGYLGSGIDPNGEFDDEEDTVFLPPEETPIPERRFGGLLPRRDR